MSGHSKWATIKRKKGALDAKRGKLFTKLIKELTVAARMGGGDPNGNPRLRKAITDAKGQAMPADTIKRAVQRGTGELEGANYEEILYEGAAPGGALFVVECLTDNKNRTVAEIRKAFEKHNGALGASGSASWAFERKGTLAVAKDATNEDQLMEVAVGAGAEDYALVEDEWQLVTGVSELDAVTKALEEAKVTVKSSGVAWIPKAKKPLGGREAELCMGLYDQLDDHDDVQNVYADFDIEGDEAGG
jgi:YebC/PmpR family DNA-binding regulatory protein